MTADRSSILHFLTAIHPEVDEAAVRMYLDNMEEVSFPKKHTVTEAGAVQKDLFFVLEGIQKAFFLHDGKEHVIAFTYPPSFSGIPESFLTQTPSRYFLQTITATRMLRISYNRHMELLRAHRPIETLVRIATEQILFGVVHRHHELMAYDIETRFRNFMERSPHLLNLVPRKDLASYLRIDPSNFSKLLGRIKI